MRRYYLTLTVSVTAMDEYDAATVGRRVADSIPADENVEGAMFIEARDMSSNAQKIRHTSDWFDRKPW